jgi:hypothetical protein
LRASHFRPYQRCIATRACFVGMRAHEFSPLILLSLIIYCGGTPPIC